MIRPMPIGSRPTVDVVIPVRDGERFLGACLDSVLAQTYPLDYIFVVDDGSKDSTAAVAAEYVAQDPRVRLIETEPCGLPHARNVGIRTSSAEFVAFIDSDDVWMPEKIERQIAVFNAAPPRVGFVHSAYFEIDENGRRLDRTHYMSPTKRGDVFLDILEGYSVSGSASAVMARKQLLVQAGYFDEDLAFGEDLDLWLRLAKISHIDYAPDALVGIRQHADSMQRRRDPSRSERSFLAKLYTLEKWLAYVKGNQNVLEPCRMHAVQVNIERVLCRFKTGFYELMRQRAPELTETMFADASAYRWYAAWAAGRIVRAKLSTMRHRYVPYARPRSAAS